MVVTTFTPEDDAAMGLGGPAGGDLYWATRMGYRSSSSHREREATGAGRLIAGHGFPPDEPDMRTVFCAVGPGLGEGVRGGAIRITAVAPTISDYLGVFPPLDAVGQSILDQLTTR